MKQVVTIKEMQEMEKKTFVKQNITPFDLMIKVGQAMFKIYNEQYQKNHLIIIAGTGNNGGDALVFGEQAFLDGKHMEAIMIGDQKNQSDESLSMTKRYLEKGISFTIVNDFDTFLKQVEKNSNIEMIVDGLLGIGLTRNVTGLYEEVINWINAQKATILSIDIPSGLHPETGQIMGASVRANITYTVEAIKQGMLLEDAMDVVGKIEVIDVDMVKIENNKYYFDTF